MSVLEKVKELREVTGAGMQDCKNALKENNNDIDKSVEYLRKKGVLKASKKSSRDAAEGLIIIGENENNFTLTEINTETDFVAKNNEFIEFCSKVSEVSLNANSLDELQNQKLNDSTIQESIVNLISKIGENIKLRRFENINKDGKKISYYIHNKSSDLTGKIVAVVKYNSSKVESKNLSNNVCMHVAAMSPMSLDEKSLDKNFLESEKKIIEEQLSKEGKKPEIIKKIMTGKLNKVISENTLLGQNWVVDQDITVKKAIENFNKDNSDNFEIISYHKYKVGEGIEIKKTDFSEEVKSLTK
ncbi:MAG: translation elongation factor Ts [Pelagibacteraceae bacterium]|nr:translation elongation factor Ts [Pelagibacteraceae bacterium]OUV89274.1 MAG: translation elongation factor Ts [Pelagibacteraceae bacterium TMED146]|tara:strand:- start:276 stop:1178 length:903 start_codon:yes stop_codon:yes gene_type:complete